MPCGLAWCEHKRGHALIYADYPSGRQGDGTPQNREKSVKSGKRELEEVAEALGPQARGLRRYFCKMAAAEPVVSGSEFFATPFAWLTSCVSPAPACVA